MKKREKLRAQELRRRGWSINAIQKELNVAKSSVSIWVRNVQLSQKLKHQIAKGSHSQAAVEKRRASRMANESARRQGVVTRAKSEVGALSRQDLFLIGIALYWAEGRKKSRGIVDISNGDPALIRVALRFFREICLVPEEKLRGHIHIHPHLNANSAKRYWSRVTSIPTQQFIKTYRKPNKGSKGKKDSLPHGTMSVYVCDTQLQLKIRGWIEGMVDSLLDD